MGVRVRDGESKSEWKPTEDAIDLGKMGLAELVAEYDEREARIKSDVARRDAIKEALKRLGVNCELMVNGDVRFQVRRDGQFMPKKFREDYPALAADFEVRTSVLEFDLEKFKAAMPALYEQYRAPKLVRVNKP